MEGEKSYYLNLRSLIKQLPFAYNAMQYFRKIKQKLAIVNSIYGFGSYSLPRKNSRAFIIYCLNFRKFVSSKRKYRNISTNHDEVILDINNNLVEAAVAKSDFRTLGLNEEFISYCQNIANLHRTTGEVETYTDADYSKHLVNLYKPEKDKHDHFKELALNPVILKLAADYLKEVPVVGWLNLFHVSPQGDNIKIEDAMLWHLDNGNPKIFKVFICVFDTREENGPTMAYHGKYARNIWKYYNNYPGIFDDDTAIKAGFKESDKFICTGKAGTVHFVDTSRAVHCGSRSKTGRVFAHLFFHGIGDYRTFDEQYKTPEYDDVNKKILQIFA